jgi:hypothetical protein
MVSFRTVLLLALIAAVAGAAFVWVRGSVGETTLAIGAVPTPPADMPIENIVPEVLIAPPVQPAAAPPKTVAEPAHVQAQEASPTPPTFFPEVARVPPQHEARVAVQRVVHQNRRQLQHCYEQELLKNPTLAGTLVVSWTVSSFGKATDVVVKGPLGDVKPCIASRIKSWDFERPKDGGTVAVTYPFTFQPGG